MRESLKLEKSEEGGILSKLIEKYHGAKLDMVATEKVFKRIRTANQGFSSGSEHCHLTKQNTATFLCY